MTHWSAALDQVTTSVSASASAVTLGCIANLCFHLHFGWPICALIPFYFHLLFSNFFNSFWSLSVFICSFIIFSFPFTFRHLASRDQPQEEGTLASDFGISNFGFFPSTHTSFCLPNIYYVFQTIFPLPLPLPPLCFTSAMLPPLHFTSTTLPIPRDPSSLSPDFRLPFHNISSWMTSYPKHTYGDIILHFRHCSHSWPALWCCMMLQDVPFPTRFHSWLSIPFQSLLPLSHHFYFSPACDYCPEQEGSTVTYCHTSLPGVFPITSHTVRSFWHFPTPSDVFCSFRHLPQLPTISCTFWQFLCVPTFLLRSRHIPGISA